MELFDLPIAVEAAAPAALNEADLASWLHGSKITQPVYHGTGANFKKFSLKHTTQGIIWFTSDKGKIERKEAGAQGHGRIIEMYVKILKPAGWPEYEKLMLGQIKNDGYDGVILREEDGSFDGFVFKPSQIRFRPKNNEHSNPDEKEQRTTEALDEGKRRDCEYIKPHPHESDIDVYDDGKVMSTIFAPDRKNASILEFTSRQSGSGNAREALKRMKKHYATLGAQEIGFPGDSSFEFWMKMAREKLVDHLTDDDHNQVWPKRTTEALDEAAKVMTLYHGSPTKFDKFDLAKLGSGKGHDQEGPGFYLTDNLQDARGYTGSASGFVHKIEVKLRKTVPDKGRAKTTEVLQLINAAPNLADTLMNWSEDPVEAKRDSLASMMRQDNPQQTFQSVWYDFYKGKEAEYLQNMTKLGYDGLLVPRNNNVAQHVVVFNPASLRFIDVKSLAELRDMDTAGTKW